MLPSHAACRLRSHLRLTVGLLALLTALGLGASGSTQARTAPCNGSVELCQRPFNQVTLPGSHNSMSAKDLGWNMPNQTWPIPDQARHGARAMLIDVYYGKKVTVGGKEGVVNVTKAEYNPAAGHRLYLCHVSCGFGASDLIEVMSEVKDFLVAHPREVMLFVVEDSIQPDDFAASIEASGLDRFLYLGATDSPDWPTLEQMVEGNQRVVFLAEGQAGTVPWYHKAYSGTLQETGYQWPPANNPGNNTAVQFLTDPALLPASCVTNRGGTNGPLFLMNHWVSGDGIPGSADSVVPRPEMAAVVNTKEALVARANACTESRGLKPTILAVDYFDIGDTVGAARELNGVTAQPFLELKNGPKSATVKAGKAAVYKLTVSNLGDAAGKAKVCATAPKKLAPKPGCVSKTIAADTSQTVKLKVKTSRKGKGKGKVSFKLTSTGGNLSAKAVLKVKPVKKRRK